MAEEVDEVREARSMGWVPEEEWRGDKTHWVDAKTFLERGRHVMPILQSNNQKLVSRLEKLDNEVHSLKTTLQAANATIAALEESHDEDVKAQVEATRKELRAELANASREGNHESVAELTDKLTELNLASRDLEDGEGKGKKKKEEDKRAPIFETDAELRDWARKNPGFVNNPRKVALGQAISMELRQSGEVSTGAEFLDKVSEEVEKILGGEARPSKVSGGNGGSGRGSSGGGGNGKSYADLPAEAKAACDSMASRLVGPNRKHKDVESWRNSYTKQFYEQEQ